MRSRLMLLIAIPTMTAVIFGGIRVYSSVQSALTYQRVVRLANLNGKIISLVQALQTERQDTITFITLGDNGGRAAALAPNSPLAANAQLELKVLDNGDYAASSRLASQVKSLLERTGAGYPQLTRHDALAGIAAVNGLQPLREAAARSRLPALVVIQEYSDKIGTLLALDDQVAVGSSDSTLADTVRVASLASAMQEEASEQQALITAAQSSSLIGLSNTGFTPGIQTAITDAAAQQQANLTAFNNAATASQTQLLNSTLAAPTVAGAQAQVQQAITLAPTASAGTEDPVLANAESSLSDVVGGMGSVEAQLLNAVTTRSTTLRNSAITGALIWGAAVLLTLIVALIATMLVGRSMIRPLRRLRTGALEVAGVRLPETVRRMSSAEDADVPLEVKPIEVDSTDEIGEVARAFDHVHREAVRLASNEAALRGNINAMFVNLSRRSQSLVERQIRLIDDLEQGEQDSERLGNLFQMDHLATRMRRNSENLLVLAGHELSRRWTEPVPLVDVLRAAVSEIEQYERVTLNVQPGIAVRGPAVNDVVHLLAELAENATSFSAAETPVTVSGHLLNSGGVLLDITDQGVGMHSEEMAHANWRLDNPPVVDVAVSRRMGLFVVARLAARHGIRVRLRPASMGGLTALVWLPDEVITHETAVSPVGGLRRFELPVPAPDLDAGGRTGAWPGADATDDRAATVQALTAARAPRFAPLRPDLGDTNAYPSFGAGDSAPVEASGAAGAGTLTGPTALTGPAALSGPTALSGPGPSAPETADSPAMPVFGAPLTGEVSGLSHDELSLPSFSPPVGDPDRGVIVPPAVSVGEENRLPIFESVESDWFRRGKHGADRATARVTDGADGSVWTSPADEGWRAAEVAHAPVAGGVTGAGLPKRVPKANLVPGGVGAAAAAPAAPARSAQQTRDRLSSFQRGIREARVAARDDDSPGGEEDGAHS